MAETIPRLAREAAVLHGDKAALVAPTGETIGFRALDALADRFARGLIADGMEPGGKVAIWLPNCFEWVAAAIGAQRAGGTIVPLYFRLQSAEVADIVARANVERMVCSAQLAGQLAGLDLPFLSRTIAVDAAGQLLPGGQVAWEDFLDLGANVPSDALAAREAGVHGDSISDIMFTSGTTGRPKGAVFSHRSAVAAARIMQHYNQTTAADCFCPMGSFAHVGGYKQGWLTGLVSGATIAWGDAFDPASVLELVSRLGITIMPAPPITWQGLLDYRDRDRFDISRLRFVATGGTMIPPELVHRLMSELDVKQVGTGYGMTESCGMDAYTLPHHPAGKVAGLVGTSAPDTELRIVDGAGRDVALGEDGEVLIRNPRLLIGYLGDDDATRPAIDDQGWFHSGDIGRFDREGFLSITDRLKDMYIINGLNVYPAEIERCLETMDGVAQSAVVGVGEEVKGEVGAAFVVRAAGAPVSAAAVIARCRQQLAAYKVPKFVIFVDDLPRNAMGKVLKNALRAGFLEKQLQQKGQS